MDEQRLRFYETVAHPMLAVALPLFFVLLMDQLLRAAVLIGLAPRPPGTVIFLILTGIAEAAVSNALGRARSRQFLLRLRELLAVMIVAFLMFMLTTGAIFRGEFVPRDDVIYALVLVLALWVLTVSFHITLRTREAFLTTIINREGEALRSGVRDYSTEATYSTSAMRRAKRFVVVFQSLVIGLFCASLLAGTEFPSTIVFLVLAHLVVGISVLAVVDGYQEEQNYFGAGLTLKATLRRRRLGSAGLLLALAMLVAWPLVGATSIISGGTIGDLLGRIADALTPTALEIAAPPDIDIGGEGDQFVTRDSITAFVGTGGETAVARFFRVVSPWLGAALVALLLRFLLRPLFSRDMRERLQELSLRGVLSRVGQGILAVLKSLATVLTRITLSPVSAVRRIARTVAETVEVQRHAAAARRARAAEVARWREHTHIIKGFLRLIRVGEKAGVRFRTAYGPLQYTGLLGERVPTQHSALSEVGALFEEMVFSGREVRPEQTRNYEAKLRAVLDGLRHARATANRGDQE